MKALLVYPSAPTEIPRIRLFADSAIARDGAPLFLPDAFGLWSGMVCPAVRIGRLGKSISEKFAMRYVDAFSAVHVLLPADSETLVATDLFGMTDQAVITGKWFPIADFADRSFSMQVQERSNSLSLDDLHIPGYITRLTRLTTVKTGDIIIFPNHAIPSHLYPDTYVTAQIDSIPCLKFKIK